MKRSVCNVRSAGFRSRERKVATFHKVCAYIFFVQKRQKRAAAKKKAEEKKAAKQQAGARKQALVEKVVMWQGY